MKRRENRPKRHALMLRRRRLLLTLSGTTDTGNHILLENGNILAAENGDHLVQE